MKIKRLIVLTVVFAAAGLGSADAAPAKRFAGYITCGPPRHHDRVCVDGDAPSAVFRAFRHASVRYRLCVRNPDGRHRCRGERTGSRGERDLVHVPFTSGGLGRYVVTWKIQGKVVDRDSFRLVPEPA